MPMAMTGLVKDELSRVTVLKPCCRKAEVSALLRFAGGLHLASGRIVVEAELDTGVAARRLRKDIAEVFGHSSDLIVLAPSGLRKGNRYVVRVRKDGDSLARQTGLVDNYGRPVRGLPRQVVSGTTCDCEAAWRGAFLAHGSLTGPGRSMSLEITCPGPEAALALVGAARRLKIQSPATRRPPTPSCWRWPRCWPPGRTGPRSPAGSPSPARCSRPAWPGARGTWPTRSSTSTGARRPCCATSAASPISTSRWTAR